METTIKWHKVDDVPNEVLWGGDILVLYRNGIISVIGSCIHEGKWHFNAFVGFSGLHIEHEFHDVVAWAWSPDAERLLKWAVEE